MESNFASDMAILMAMRKAFAYFTDFEKRSRTMPAGISKAFRSQNEVDMYFSIGDLVRGELPLYPERMKREEQVRDFLRRLADGQIPLDSSSLFRGNNGYTF